MSGHEFNLHRWGPEQPSTISAPEPVAPAIQAGLELGYCAAEMEASTPIFQDLIREAVQRQVKYEEDQLRAWLRAIINNPAGRKLIEELL